MVSAQRRSVDSSGHKTLFEHVPRVSVGDSELSADVT